jgi:hypothetical protein
MGGILSIANIANIANILETPGNFTAWSKAGAQTSKGLFGILAILAILAMERPQRV